jgi:hypothetical protein
VCCTSAEGPGAKARRLMDQPVRLSVRSWSDSGLCLKLGFSAEEGPGASPQRLLNQPVRLSVRSWSDFGLCLKLGCSAKARIHRDKLGGDEELLGVLHVGRGTGG